MMTIISGLIQKHHILLENGTKVKTYVNHGYMCGTKVILLYDTITESIMEIKPESTWGLDLIQPPQSIEEEGVSPEPIYEPSNRKEEQPRHTRKDSQDLEILGCFSETDL